VSGLLTDVAGIAVGHHTDEDAWTGCTVIVVPDGATTSCEVRGLAPGTRETALLGPAGSVQAAHAILLTGGSAFGLAAADGVVRALEAQGRGHPTFAANVPIVPAAVIYDLPLGRADIRPGPADGAAAFQAAVEGGHAVGSVGAGTGAAVGKRDGREGWVKGGLGSASRRLDDGVTIAALAVANAFGDVLGEDGAVLAGLRRGGRFVRTTDTLADEPLVRPPVGQNTTLVCVATDARLSKTEAWQLARASHAGVARATDPAASALDGDVAFAVATGRREPTMPLALGPVAAAVTAAAIRDAVRQATSAPGCPALRDLEPTFRPA
jgi:L-aminopeptidase/D-esterase-like protein